MAVIEVKYDWKRSGSLTLDKDYLNKTEMYTVLFDNKDNPRQRSFLAYTASAKGISVPAYGSRHPYHAVYVFKITVDSAEGPFLFDVRCDYSSNLFYQGVPWREEPVIRWGSSVSNEKIDKDINGKAILNSANQSPDPPVTEDVYDTTLTISENVKKFDSDKAAEFKNKVNSNTFYGKPPGSVLCVEYSAEQAWFGKEKYYKVVKGFVIRLPAVAGVKGWTRRILDEGFMVLDGSNNKNVKLGADDKSKRIIDNVTDKNPVSEPQLLDGKGQLLAPSPAGPAGTLSQSGVYLKFETKKAISFAGLA